MDDYQRVLEFNKVELDKIQWSTAYFTISEFLKKFKFPQIVKVIVGFYGESSESTVNANQVLCLHSIKSVQKIRAHDSNGRKFSICLDCQRKVEVRPSHLKDIYDNIDELCEVFPRYVRISQGYYDASKDEEILNVGDKLKLQSIEKGKSGKKKLICTNQNGKLIALSQDCVAGFQPLVNEKEYYPQEVLKDFSLPLQVRFVEPNIRDKEIQQPLGTVSLEETFSDTVITATSIQSDGKHSMVEFSPETDVCLLVCEETFRKSADYVRICQSLKKYVDPQNNHKKSATEMIQREMPHSNTTKSNLAKNLVKSIAGLRKPAPESPIPKEKPNFAMTIPPRPPKAKPDPANVIPPKPPARKSKSDPAKVTPPKPSTIKAMPDLRRAIPPKSSSLKAKPGPAKEILPEPALINVTPDPQKTKPKSSTQDHELKNIISTSTHDAKTAEENLHFRQTHNKNVGHSQHQPTIDEFGYADPNEVFKQHGSTEQENSEYRFVECSTYTAPDRTYVSINSHEYAKPYVEPQSILVPSAKSNQPSHSRTSVAAAKPLPQVPFSPPRQKFSEPGGSPSLHTKKVPVLTPEQHEEMYQAIAKYPTDLSKLSVTEVSRLLHNLGMDNYAEVFAAEMIDGEMLSSMNAENLQSLNLSSFHVKKLSKFVGGWRPNV